MEMGAENDWQKDKQNHELIGKCHSLYKPKKKEEKHGFQNKPLIRRHRASQKQWKTSVASHYENAATIKSDFRT